MSDLVYTCVFDDYDWVLPPVAPAPGLRHALITDSDGPAPRGWERRVVDPARWGGAAAANRWWKMLGHRELPEARRTLYVDANIRLLGDSAGFLDLALQGTAAMGLFRHPLRDTVADEIAACAATGKIADPAPARATLARHRAEGFGDEAGLSENTILARRVDAPGLDAAMEMWWDLYRARNDRDQFSLPVVRWCTGLEVNWIDWSFRDANPWFAIYPHRGARGVNPRYAWMSARAHDSALHAGLLRAWNAARAVRRGLRTTLKGQSA
ncbi:glycosyltransferase domain-containing protein [Roseobacter sp. HKCCA0434]|uniref:glycosyltransferase domain-containing protein n=1 Tax=Roseobacter sp. HKCCA0434 TaxID=3079297 RepID=UPI002905A0B3|nr:glycosyltransferase domain-containing protein [Roseobacter sp. HKCCA0434]